jgi:hypothetical protein
MVRLLFLMAYRVRLWGIDLSYRSELLRVDAVLAEALYQYMITRRRYLNYQRRNDRPPERIRLTHSIRVILQQKFDAEGRLR